MDIIATTAITALVSSLVGAIVAAVVAAIRTHTSDTAQSAKAMEAGMRALLWRELSNIYNDAMLRNGLSIGERQHLENVYKAYHDGIHGNGTGTRMYKEAMSTPILQEVNQ